MIVAHLTLGSLGPCSQGEGGDKQEELFLMLSSWGQCVSSLASGIATSYTSVGLARREAVLVKSSIPPRMRSSLRVLPLSDSLFGQQVSEMVYQASERARDSAFLRPPRAPAPFSKGAPAGRGNKRRFGGSSGGSPRAEGTGSLTLRGRTLPQRAGHLGGGGASPPPQ